MAELSPDGVPSCVGLMIVDVVVPMTDVVPLYTLAGMRCCIANLYNTGGK